MSADIVRHAAAVMRERAEGTLRAHIPAWYEVNAVALNGFPQQDRVQIASWHPNAVLAVAMLLDNEANAMESSEEGLAVTPYNNARRQLLTDIARTYLGDQS